MIVLFSWLITALIVSLVVSFGVYIVAVVRLPSDERPAPYVYNRFGALLGKAENPDYRINPGEPALGELTILPLRDRRSGTKT